MSECSWGPTPTRLARANALARAAGAALARIRNRTSPTKSNVTGSDSSSFRRTRIGAHRPSARRRSPADRPGNRDDGLHGVVLPLTAAGPVAILFSGVRRRAPLPVDDADLKGRAAAHTGKQNGNCDR